MEREKGSVREKGSAPENEGLELGDGEKGGAQRVHYDAG